MFICFSECRLPGRSRRCAMTGETLKIENYLSEYPCNYTAKKQGYLTYFTAAKRHTKMPQFFARTIRCLWKSTGYCCH